MAASTDLLPGETVFHEEFAHPGKGLLFAAVFLGLFGLVNIGTSSGTAFGMLAIAGGLAWYHFKGGDREPKVTVRVTSRRVIAYSPKGVDEMQVAKIESVRADGKAVTVTGSGGAKFTITGGNPLQVREAIQRALAEQQK